MLNRMAYVVRFNVYFFIKLEKFSFSEDIYVFVIKEILCIMLKNYLKTINKVM